MRVLIVRLSALGDVVMGLHVLSTLRARVGSAGSDPLEVGWLVEDRFQNVLADHPQIDTLHVYERQRLLTPTGLRAFGGLVRELRAAQYDAVLDLQANLKSGLLSWFSGARRRIGPQKPLSKEGNAFFMTELVPAPHAHRFETYRALVDAVSGPGEDVHAVLPSSGEAHDSIVLHPGVSAFGAFKRWPAANFGELGTRLAKRLGRPVMVTAGPGERSQAEEVVAAMDADATIVEPPSIRALIDTLAGSRIVVAADTGPAHLAAAAGAPTLTLFGPKDPNLLAPLGPRTATARAGVRCSPCSLRACPDPICMTQLSVDHVESRALELLD